MKQKIKLNIGNRIYPLSVSVQQEEVLRKAAKEINEMITKYEKSYAVLRIIKKSQWINPN